MKRMTAILSATAVVLATSFVFAQNPSFAGKWVREAPAAGAPAPGGGRGGRGGGFGQEVTITQDAKTITMEYMQPGRGGAEGTMQKRVYMLDGSESKNPGFGGNEQVSKATWQAGKLVITSTTQFGETKQTLSLVGGNLNVEQTNPGREGGAPTTTTIVYKKAS